MLGQEVLRAPKRDSSRLLQLSPSLTRNAYPMPQIDTSLLLTINAASILRAPAPQVQKRNGVRYHSLPPWQPTHSRQSTEPTRQPQPRPVPAPKPVPTLRTEETPSRSTSLALTKSTPDGFKIPEIPKARKSLPLPSQTTEYASSPALVLKRKLSDLYSRKIPTIPSKVPTIESTEKISSTPNISTTAQQLQPVRSDLVKLQKVAVTPHANNAQGNDAIDPPKRSRGRPRKDGTPAQPRLKPPSTVGINKVPDKTPVVAPTKNILETRVSPPQHAGTKASSPEKPQEIAPIASPKANTNPNLDTSLSTSSSAPTPEESAPVKRPRGRPRKHPLPSEQHIAPPPKHRTPSPIRDDPIKRDPKDDHHDNEDDKFNPPVEPTRSGRSIKPPSDWWSTTRRSSGESIPRLTWGEMPPDTPRRREGSLAREGSLVRQLTDNSDLSTRHLMRHIAETPLVQRGRSKLGMSVFMPSPPPEPAIDPVLLADTTLTDLKQAKSSQSIEALPDSQGEDVIIDSAEEEWPSTTIPMQIGGHVQNAKIASDDEDYRPRPQKPKKPKSSKVNKDPDAPKRPRGRPRKHPLPDNNGKDKEQRSAIQSGNSTAIIQHVTAIPSLPKHNTMSWHFSDED